MSVDGGNDYEQTHVNKVRRRSTGEELETVYCDSEIFKKEKSNLMEHETENN